jgi:hypothetical protein
MNPMVRILWLRSNDRLRVVMRIVPSNPNKLKRHVDHLRFIYCDDTVVVGPELRLETAASLRYCLNQAGGTALHFTRNTYHQFCQENNLGQVSDKWLA